MMRKLDSKNVVVEEAGVKGDQWAASSGHLSNYLEMVKPC